MYIIYKIYIIYIIYDIYKIYIIYNIYVIYVVYIIYNVYNIYVIGLLAQPLFHPPFRECSGGLWGVHRVGVPPSASWFCGGSNQPTFPHAPRHR